MPTKRFVVGTGFLSALLLEDVDAPAAISLLREHEKALFISPLTVLMEFSIAFRGRISQDGHLLPYVQRTVIDV